MPDQQECLLRHRGLGRLIIATCFVPVVILLFLLLFLAAFIFWIIIIIVPPTRNVLILTVIICVAGSSRVLLSKGGRKASALLTVELEEVIAALVPDATDETSREEAPLHFGFSRRFPTSGRVEQSQKQLMLIPVPTTVPLFFSGQSIVIQI
jgi:hypothetical protein